MNRIVSKAGALLALFMISAVPAVQADPVVDWNRIATTAIVNNAGKPPTTASILLAYVHGAIYDAVQAIEGHYVPYAYTPPKLDPSASKEAAVASAGYHVLNVAFPGQSNFLDAVYKEALAAVPPGKAKHRGMVLGARAAEAMLAKRLGDGLEASTSLPDAVGPGIWQPTPPANLPALTPWMAEMRPFSLRFPDQFRAAGPPDLGSKEWAKDYNEVKALGSATGSPRTPEQTEISRFWTEHPAAQYARIWRDLAQSQALTLSQNARLFAMLTFGWADSLIACFESKYHYRFWRPVTAIRAGGADGNEWTAPDAAWLPVQVTPNHPEYPGAHAASAGAIARVIEEFFGTNNVQIPLSSAVTKTSRAANSTDDFVKELIEARILGGMHFRTSSRHGADLGKKVGRWLTRHLFQPVTTSLGAQQ